MAQKNSGLSVFREALDAFKHKEKAESVLLLAQDGQLIRLLLAWDSVPVRRARRLSERPRDRGNLSCWQWLWENVSYSVEDLAALSGLSADQVEKHMPVLRGNRLVYPDGTINRYAAQYVKTKVLDLFKAKRSSTTGSQKLAKNARN